MEKYQKALKFIAKHHSGQKRKNGNPYIIHPIRVSQEVHSEEEKVTALLHDVVEDSAVSLLDIEYLFGKDVREAVDAITSREGENYFDYIIRVKNNKIATVVKIADISDNLADSPSSKSIEKYAQALDFLVNSSVQQP